ncbi:Zn-dependent peptidase ImmA (M78 family)/DNA-binding XRE family transcriptional regulator [Actinopolyspora lacussalsi]|nr:Zn-dependent peptidase ImmA (M78 family)/DNA-binding XRE family transcriptional regulator [Actinopolyspora lacussalsi]
MMFSPGRLTLARARRRLPQAELAGYVGVPARRISDFERGRAEPGEDTLRLLAERLRFPVEFFAREEPAEIATDAVSFRARRKTAKRKVGAAVSASTLAVEFNDWLERNFELPAPDVPDLGGFDPHTAAEMLRVRWSVDCKPVPNLVHLLESRGVRVFAHAADYSDVDAFSFRHSARPFVFLNTFTSGERGRFDAAHELGHLVLHSGSVELTGSAVEREADAFAGAFLMPRDSVFASMPRSPLTGQLLEGKSIWRVSAMALAHRVHELGLLGEERYRDACVELSARGYRDGEPDGVRREGSQLLEKVLRSLRARGISVGRIAEELALPVEDVAGFLRGLAIVPVHETVDSVERMRVHRESEQTRGYPALKPVPSG